MKKIFLTILLGISLSLHAQNTTIAKINFEAAEEAYNNSNYELALEKLQKAEENFGQINLPILYLRIVNQDKFLAQKPSFALLQDLQKNCKDFLSKYSNDADAFEKIKDVYNIEEKWSNYKTEADFGTFLKEQKRKNLIDFAKEIEKDYINASSKNQNNNTTGIVGFSERSNDKIEFSFDFENRFFLMHRTINGYINSTLHLTDVKLLEIVPGKIIIHHNSKTKSYGLKEKATIYYGDILHNKLLKLIKELETIE